MEFWQEVEVDVQISIFTWKCVNQNSLYSHNQKKKNTPFILTFIEHQCFPFHQLTEFWKVRLITFYTWETWNSETYLSDCPQTPEVACHTVSLHSRASARLPHQSQDFAVTQALEPVSIKELSSPYVMRGTEWTQWSTAGRLQRPPQHQAVLLL